MKIKNSEYFEINEAGRIIFKKGKYSGKTLDEVNLLSKFYLPFLKFRAKSDVDKTILTEISDDKEEREIYDEYFSEKEE